jgi:hypothetical protein
LSAGIRWSGTGCVGIGCGRGWRIRWGVRAGWGWCSRICIRDGVGVSVGRGIGFGGCLRRRKCDCGSWGDGVGSRVGRARRHCRSVRARGGWGEGTGATAA